MKCRRFEILVILLIVSTLCLKPTAARGQEDGEASIQPFDLDSLLQTRDPSAMLSPLKEGLQDNVRDAWSERIMEDAQIAEARNKNDLYANPSLQLYVNRLGQSLIPREASADVLLSFKVVRDPLPYADSLSTGTIYLSTGIVSLLDNESQLAFLLMHEAGHVILSHHLYQVIDEAKAEKKAKRIKMISAAAGVLAGGLLGPGGMELIGGMAGHYGAKYGVGVAGRFRDRRFLRTLQFEADEFAAEILLEHGFDAREAPILLAKMGDLIRRSNAAVELAFGNAKDLPHRTTRMQALLEGSYEPLIHRALEGEGFQMSSPRYHQFMSELKRDNGYFALDMDLFAIARANFEEAAAVRTDDPLTMYGLGMLYRTIGRTEEEIGQAASHLRAAMEFDELRHRYPQAYLQYAVELLSREDPTLYPEIQKALKNYVTLHQRKTGGALPREMQFVYDYLDLTGDHDWIAYHVRNVSSDQPYQLTGDPKMDRAALTGPTSTGSDSGSP